MMLTAENIDKMKLEQAEADKLGITRPMFYICQYLFDHLSETNKSDGTEFLEAASNTMGGKDLSSVPLLFLKDCSEHIPQQEDAVQEVIEPVIEALSLLTQGKELPVPLKQRVASIGSKIWDDAEHADAAYATYFAASIAKSVAASEATYDCQHFIPCCHSALAAPSFIDEIRRQAEALLRLLKEAPVKEEKNDV